MIVISSSSIRMALSWVWFRCWRESWKVKFHTAQRSFTYILFRRFERALLRYRYMYLSRCLSWKFKLDIHGSYTWLYCFSLVFQVRVRPHSVSILDGCKIERYLQFGCSIVKYVANYVHIYSLSDYDTTADVTVRSWILWDFSWR